MNDFPPTIVIRHRKENLKKCSLRGLEKREDFLFFRYPLQELLPTMDYTLLTVDSSEELSEADKNRGLLILDATWRLAQIMEKNIPALAGLKKRHLPQNILTAYPRRQNDCPNPSQGLASLEAIVCAYSLLGRPIGGLLDEYHWKDSFLEKNGLFLLKCAYERED